MRPRTCALVLLLLPPLLLTLVATLALLYEHCCSDFSALSHYEALGVAPSTQLRAVKRAFRELSLRFHPDKSGVSGGSDALTVRRFHRISEAYQVLSDPHARAAYDREMRERERHSPQLRFTPPTRDWRSALRFYAADLPRQAAQLALRHVDAQRLLLLIAGAIAVIVTGNVVARVARALWSILTRSPTPDGARKRANDAAMQAARLRQQQVLDASSARVPAKQRLRMLPSS
ncbi:hypothetical protein PybrP1_008534 [[Pythium] brassicae (nom. inval.)]|nr:hypothetical protein PybrP1_008534 [[Pythium] brassicae (nom. inval.)]